MWAAGLGGRSSTSVNSRSAAIGDSAAGRRCSSSAATREERERGMTVTAARGRSGGGGAGIEENFDGIRFLGIDRMRVLVPPLRRPGRTLRAHRHLLNNYLMRKVRDSYSWLIPLWLTLWVLVAFIIYLWLSSEAVDKRRESLASMCDERARMLQGQFNVSMQQLQALAILVSTFHHSNTPSAIQTLARYAERTAFQRPLTSGVAYGVRVTHAERDQFERQQGWSIKKMYSSKTKKQEYAEVREPAEEYAPVIFAQGTYKHVISFDLLSGADERDNVLRARESGKGVLTAPFKLLNNRLGVISTYAVYKYELPPNARPYERIQASIGYLGGIFDFEALVDKLLHQLAGKPSIVVNVYDTTNERPISMYGSNDTGSGMCQVSTLNFGDPSRKHEMHCRFIQSPPWPWMAITTSIGTLLIGLLVGYIIHATAKRIAKVEDDFQNMSLRVEDDFQKMSLRVEDDFQKMSLLKERTEDADIAKSQGKMSSTLVSINEFPTSSSRGAMGPVIRKLDLLLDSKNQLIRGPAKEAIKLLKKDLDEINADLEELSMVERPNYKSRYWMQEVRELSYHIEDCIDNMKQSRAAAETKVRFSSRRPQLRIRRRVKIPWLPKTVQPSERIAELRTQLCEARERHERYQLQDCVSSEPRFLFSGNSCAPASSSLSGAAANNSLVGVDGTRGILTSWLIDQMEEEQQQLKVLSILGPAGVGKTALAKELYLQLGHQFECRAFVRVSRNPDMRRLLGEILAQVQERKRDYEYEGASTADNLMDSIRSHLQDKRYFVVIDELWDAAAWNIMNVAFPKGNNFSRIIITAEGKDVASKCYCVNKLEMAPLGNLQDSGKIFFDRVFGSEHQCPDQLKDICCMIIRSCGGFPLSITTTASLLVSQIDNTELWDYLQKCFVSRLTGVTLEETCKEVVNICYDALPQDLKTCLLYLTMYPEGSTIRKADLLNQWIVEGFITPKEENQTVAESYFAELINRGMIQPEKIDNNDEVLSCTVHHIVFGVIAQKSREENFITALDYSQAMPGFSMIARRLSLYFSCAQFAAKPEGINLSQIRSLAFYGLLTCMPSITKFKFVRVLILEFWDDDYHHSLDLSKLCMLFHLRYLKVSSHTVVVLPSKIQRLQSLETLEIDAKVSAVPTDILHLPGLLHLSLPNGTELPDGIGRITSLQTLEHFDLGSNSEDNAQSLGDLMNLQNLHVTCSKAVSYHHLGWNLLHSLNGIFSCSKKSDHHLNRSLVALSSSIGRLANLKSLRVGPFALGMTVFIDQDDMPCTPKLLERLELLPSSFIFSRLPTWIGALQKLCILKIAVRVLLSSDIDTLTGLPFLAVLSLYVHKPNAESVVFNNGSLPALKYFKYRCAELHLGFQKEALPNLQKLKLCFNVHRAESLTFKLAGIENLLKLKEITAEIGAAVGAGESDRRAAESVLEKATQKYQRFPIHMNVKSVGCFEKESMPVGFVHPTLYILAFLAWFVGVLIIVGMTYFVMS